MNGIGRSSSRTRRFASGVLATVAALLVVWCPAEPAGAAITTFTMAPTAGAPGTVVHVRGRGCAPGLLGSQQTNFVTVTATTLDIVFRVPVAADGGWSGSFTVPAGGAGMLGSSAPVTAACVSTGLASLTTIYTPKAFTVTAASAPTTVPVSPPTTGEPTDRTVVIPGDTTTVISVPPTAGRSSGDNADGPTAARRAADKQTAAKRDAKARQTEPATLQPADIDTRSAAGTGGAGLGWLGWTLLLVLLLAVLGASGFVWHARHPHEGADGGWA